jgi:lipopolysaccharide export LptBFGC system permease protein LptF
VRFGATARVGVAGLRTEDYPLLHGIVLGIFAALIAFFGISLVQYVGADPAIMTIFWFTVGLAIAIDQLTRTHAPLTARDQ